MTAPARDRPDRLVLLDRDGVVNDDSPDFVKSVEEWRPLPGSLEAIGRLTRAGYRVAIVTNQSGIGRGLIRREALEAIHDQMCRAAERAGGRIDGIFFCPHRPEEGCGCRKPAPGLIHQAEAALSLSARGVPMVGDRATDVAAARVAGCRPFGVETGRGLADLAGAERDGVEIHADLASFVDAFLEQD